jgi:hypothetical protein
MIRKFAKSAFLWVEAFPCMLLSIVTVILYGVGRQRLGQKERLNKRCVVVGNGPSLKLDIEDLKCLEDADFNCVNHFADVDAYSELKPKGYFFVDPYFWKADTSADFVNKRNVTFDNINLKTNWDMTIYVPCNTDQKFFNAIFENNTKITLVFYSCASVRGLPKGLANILLSSGLFVPLGINVLIHALFGAVRAGYSEIYIYGADSSWHQSLSLDQANNELFMVYDHFYGETKTPVYKDNTKTIRSNVADELMFVSLAMRTYMQISEYAEDKDIKIYNGSSYSWVDAFTRKRL